MNESAILQLMMQGGALTILAYIVYLVPQVVTKILDRIDRMVDRMNDSFDSRSNIIVDAINKQTEKMNEMNERLCKYNG